SSADSRAIAASAVPSNSATALRTRRRNSGFARTKARGGPPRGSGIVVRRAVGLQGLAQPLGQELELAVQLVQMGPELQDRLDARQIDPQVAMKAQDRPEPTDLLGTVALVNPLAHRPDQAPGLVPRQQGGRDREVL